MVQEATNVKYYVNGGQGSLGIFLCKIGLIEDKYVYWFNLTTRKIVLVGKFKSNLPAAVIACSSNLDSHHMTYDLEVNAGGYYLLVATSWLTQYLMWGGFWWATVYTSVQVGGVSSDELKTMLISDNIVQHIHKQVFLMRKTWIIFISYDIRDIYIIYTIFIYNKYTIYLP